MKYKVIDKGGDSYQVIKELPRKEPEHFGRTTIAICRHLEDAVMIARRLNEKEVG